MVLDELLELVLESSALVLLFHGHREEFLAQYGIVQ